MAQRASSQHSLAVCSFEAPQYRGLLQINEKIQQRSGAGMLVFVRGSCGNWTCEQDLTRRTWRSRRSWRLTFHSNT